MFCNYLSQNVLILSLLLTSFCHTLSPFKQPAWAAAATVSEKTKAARIENRWIPPKLTPHEANLLSPKKTSSKYRANESRAELAQTMPSEADIMQHRTDGTDALILSTSAQKNFRIEKVTLPRQQEFCSGCETVCANESRAELVPAMPSAAKLGELVHKLPYRDA